MMLNLFTMATAVAEGAEGAAAADNSILALIVNLLPMVILVVVFYFMLIRPQQKKDKETRKMLDELKVSDRICTIGGIYGTITKINEDTITLAVGRADTEMVIARWAVRSVENVAAENDSMLS